jgi:SAM-dependent methyltransferase
MPPGAWCAAGPGRVVAEALGSRASIRIVDLGCGSGANLRYLAPRLHARQDWLLIDNDPDLLTLAATSAHQAPGGIQVSSRLLDLGSLDDSIFAGRDLVTASALLDLVPEAWLAGVVERCRRHAACFLAVLNYDGRIECAPRDSDDDRVRALVNRHQRGDKGLGAALGPDAGDRAEALLQHAGFRVVRERSDWLLTERHEALQRALIDGWALAASELMPDDGGEIDAWRLRRHEYVSQGRSRLRVGHDDVAGVPPGSRRGDGSPGLR